MGRGRGIGALPVMVAAAAILAGAPAALADGGSPQDICKSLQAAAANGTMTQAQIDQALQDPTIQGYCGPIVVPPPGPATPPVLHQAPAKVSIVTRRPATVHVSAANHTVRKAAPLTTARAAGTLPFTGAQLGVFVLVGLGLIGTGLLLRATSPKRERS